MREVVPVSMLLLLTLPCSAPFLRQRNPPFYNSDPLEDDVELPGGKVSFPNVLGGSKLLRLNNTRELIRSWTVVSRYIVHVLAKDPVRAGVCIIVLRCMGTCGASTCQDITINYRLLFHAYTASSWLVCAGVVFVAIFALSCDYNLDTGMKKLEKYVQDYKGKIHSFLEEKMVKASNSIVFLFASVDLRHAAQVTFENMSTQLKKSRYIFSQSFGGRAERAIAGKLRDDLKARSIFGEFVYNNSIVITVADLMQQLRGQLFAFGYEVRHVEDGVNSMTTILFTNATSDTSNRLDITGLKDLVKYSIIAMMFFVVVTMGGMMAGFTLGFANHYGHASPLERNALSNVAGYVLVLHCREHVGIGSLAGIKPKDLEAALDYKIDIRSLVEEVTARWKVVQEFKEQFEKRDLKTFLDFTIEECDNLKNNISSYIDENGYWLSIMGLVGIYVYGIYISLTASKYLYTMKSYTYEGEAVPPGVAAAAGTLNEDERLRSEDAE
ncbi:hypothetical protein HPB52_010573 [Rhipicephalus sanguineus]|uniref:Uncharacterized protein n=1 Tax=Rhipicephalus sanguineus TaxID=34632 RepID=A0A9D4PNX7_RHISA|nr:hypothetical protein HPB52_010573 [Rhipicephalus sanguineus]